MIVTLQDLAPLEELERLRRPAATARRPCRALPSQARIAVTVVVR